MTETWTQDSRHVHPTVNRGFNDFAMFADDGVRKEKRQLRALELINWQIKLDTKYTKLLILELSTFRFFQVLVVLYVLGFNMQIAATGCKITK